MLDRIVAYSFEKNGFCLRVSGFMAFSVSMCWGLEGLKEFGVPWTTIACTGLCRVSPGEMSGIQLLPLTHKVSACEAVFGYRTRSFNGWWWTNQI